MGGAGGVVVYHKGLDASPHGLAYIVCLYRVELLHTWHVYLLDTQKSSHCSIHKLYSMSFYKCFSSICCSL